MDDFRDTVNRHGNNDLTVQIPYLRQIGDGYLQRFRSTHDWTDALKVGKDET